MSVRDSVHASEERHDQRTGGGQRQARTPSIDWCRS